MRNKQTRKMKSEIGALPKVKEKFVAENLEKVINSFVPSEDQKDFISKIHHNTITFVDSEAASGKTSSTLYYFCKEYVKDPYKQIIVVRTPVEVGTDKVGYLSGDLTQKLEVHYQSTREALEKFLGKPRVEADLGERIHFRIPNYMLGATLDNCLVLIDEAQQLSPEILKLMLTRIGQDSKVVVAGCSNQMFKTGYGRDALKDAWNRFTEEFEGEVVPKYDGVEIHQFKATEQHRHPVVSSVIHAYADVGGDQ